jgi:hypothetical protein
MAHPRWARTSSGGGAQVGQQLGLAGEHGGEDRAGHGEQLRDLRGFPPLSQESPSCTVAVVALPLALAFGVSSGLGAQAGLVTAVVAGSLAAVFGGSNLQVSGPTGAMTVVLMDSVSAIEHARAHVVLRSTPAAA